MLTVDFEEVVAEAVATLGSVEETEVAKNFARQWIWRAKQKLAIPDQEIKVCCIYPKNLLIRKPTDLKQTLDIALYDASGNWLPHQFHQGNKRIYPHDVIEGYVTISTTSNGVTTQTILTPIDLSESDSSFVIGTNGTSVALALLRYYPLPLDKNNVPQVYEHEVDAVCAYVRWKWSQRKNDNQSEIRENKINWMQECDWAIAKTKSLDFSNELKKTSASILNRMIPNFNRNKF